jgi:dTDP-glucose 4,6-dehydratase
LKILVTGGAGFIGLNYSIYLLEEYPKVEIVIYDYLLIGSNLYNLALLSANPRLKFIYGSILDNELLSLVIEKERPNAIVNFAAESHVDRSIDSPLSFMETNINGTVNLLELTRKYNIERFHQVSTDEVYGDIDIESKIKFYENSNLKPSSPYSASKASADLICLSYHRTYKTNITVSRSSNNYGAGQYPEKLIPVVFKSIANGEKIPIYGDGKNVRDWIHVYDHCRAIDLILKNGTNGEIYNVSSGNEMSNIEIVKHILNLAGHNEEMINFVNDRPGHDKKYSVNSEKIENELGWKPTINFDQGMKDTYNTYLNTIEISGNTTEHFKDLIIKQSHINKLNFESYISELNLILYDFRMIIFEQYKAL